MVGEARPEPPPPSRVARRRRRRLTVLVLVALVLVVVALPFSPSAAQIVAVEIQPHTFLDLTENSGFESAAGWHFEAHGGRYDIAAVPDGAGARSLFLQGAGSDVSNVTVLYNGTGALRPQVITPDVVVRFQLRFEPDPARGANASLAVATRIVWNNRAAFRFGLAIGDVASDADHVTPNGITLLRRVPPVAAWTEYVLGLEAVKPLFERYLQTFGGAPEATEADDFQVLGLGVTPVNASLWVDELAISRIEAARVALSLRSGSVLPMNLFVTEVRANGSRLEFFADPTFLLPLATFRVQAALLGPLMAEAALQFEVVFGTGLVVQAVYRVPADLAPRWL